MPWSGRDATSLHINGAAILKIGGTEVGFVSNMEADATPIVAESTVGDATAGYDLILKGDILSNSPGNWTNAQSNLFASRVELYGNTDMAFLTNVWVKYTLKQLFSGKAGSMIQFEAKQPGATVSAATSFFTSAS